MSDQDLEKWDSLGLKYWNNRNERQKWAHDFILHPEFLRLIKTLDIVPSSKLLDFGCGDGSLLNFFHTHDLDCKCYGSDKSQVLMQIARSNCPYAGFVDSPLDLTFDVICMNMVIQDISDPIDVLSELRKAMNDNGALIISIPHPVFSLIQSQHLTTVRKIKDPSGQKDICRYLYEETEEVYWNDSCDASTNLYNRTIATYADYFRSSGYMIVDITEPSPIPQGKCDMELYDIHKLVPRFMFITACKR